MKHLGDITKISGYTAPVVDVVIGGSPCQDLSVAGKRAGLDGERSGLFMEQIRIIKEMRDRDKRDGRSGVDVRPRYMVWENVPGAFSSNKGEDFRIVLEETAKVADKNAVIPRPADGKWQTSGCIVGKGYSIVWRTLDAQFWGVPQRRRRIALVADFGGQSAPEILFVRESMSGHTEPSEPKREAASSDAEGGVGADDRSGVGLDLYNFAVTGDKAVTLNANSGISAGRAGSMLLTLDRASFNQGKNAQYDFEVSDKGLASPIVAKGSSAVCYGIGSYHSNAWKSDNPYSGVYETDVAKTLDALGCGYPGCNQGGTAVVAAVDARNATEAPINGALQSNSAHSLNGNNVVRIRYIVRRLTPMECERLQGYPDGWTDIGEYIDSTGKKRQTSDAARFRALGNSIALPPWKWVLKRLCACYERDATMASLFDGIGGFPYIWEQLNGKGSCLWASEIEEFPIAVTKVRIGE